MIYHTVLWLLLFLTVDLLILLMPPALLLICLNLLYCFFASNSLLTPIRKFATFLLPFGGRLVFSFRKISLFHSCFFFSSSSISLSAKNSFHLNTLSNFLHSVRICVILSLSGATQKLRPFKSFSLASVRTIFK